MKNSNLKIQQNLYPPKPRSFFEKGGAREGEQGPITRIQGLPEPKRKIIFWLVIVIIGLGLLTFYVKNVQKRLKGLELEKFKEGLPLPSGKELEGLPKKEIPKLPKGILK